MEMPSSDHKARIHALQLIRKHQQKILSYIKDREISEFQGDEVFCVVCKNAFSSFAPYHAWVEKALPEEINIHASGSMSIECHSDTRIQRCPACGSFERQRLLWKYLEERSDIFKKKPLRLLEMAPDKPFFDLFSTWQGIEYYPCDLYPERDKFLIFNGNVMKEDITALSFQDDFFDVILCNHVLEHIPEDKKAMNELLRVMKKGGWGIFQVPVDYERETTYEDSSITKPVEREKAFGQRDHVRWYGKDYPERLESVGFRVNCDTFVQEFSSEEVSRYGFDPREIMYRCYK